MHHGTSSLVDEFATSLVTSFPVHKWQRIPDALFSRDLKNQQVSSYMYMLCRIYRIRSRPQPGSYNFPYKQGRGRGFSAKPGRD